MITLEPWAKLQPGSRDLAPVMVTESFTPSREKKWQKLHREGLIHTRPLGVEQMHPSAGKHLPAELGWQGALSLAEGQGIGARRWKIQGNVGYAHTCWAAASQGWESALNPS